ncbi:beta-glucuronosyltransferase 14B-like [Olea europaea subsp. europaea]|uniref:Beta-glucuronosyltransferase 14B-like n=1 Tax=Olea europaea subsp. europaea TaxID=158383 RepID=A0A8S0TD27_OLEEU|nr:beta-glucuronosyltransferase 14B-like [Olea europaea subsp. europaea]
MEEPPPSSSTIDHHPTPRPPDLITIRTPSPSSSTSCHHQATELPKTAPITTQNRTTNPDFPVSHCFDCRPPPLPSSQPGASSSTMDHLQFCPKLRELVKAVLLGLFDIRSTRDGGMLRRTLQALYHPYNQYVVHLDAESSAEACFNLQNYVKTYPIFGKLKNVRMITKANLVTYSGPTMVTYTLHAAAILLNEGGDWDWFINLSASDYPLIIQDGNY